MKEEIEVEMDVRFIKVRSVFYLRAQDVFSLLEEFGGAEETDVRNRVLYLIANIKQGLL
jgi:hypothetical protein